MFHKTKNIILLLCIVLLFACVSKNVPHELTLEESEEVPPGTMKIAKNFYFDESEIRNLDYLEYLTWTERAIGHYSEEYKNALPDTNVWNKFGNEPYIKYYLRHPAYRDYPVVSISLRQANDYCKWRSDRAFEYILIREGITTWHFNSPKDSLFTIEKYFKGEWYTKPNPYLKYYPVYSLPDSSTYFFASTLADSLNKKNKKYIRKKYCSADISKCWCLETFNKSFEADIVKPVYCRTKKPLIWHLHDNVSEMTNIDGTLFGGSYKDSCKIAEKKKCFKADSTDILIGFRCICKWKKWK